MEPITHIIWSKNHVGVAIPLTWIREEVQSTPPTFQGAIAGASNVNRFYHSDWNIRAMTAEPGSDPTS